MRSVALYATFSDRLPRTPAVYFCNQAIARGRFVAAVPGFTKWSCDYSWRVFFDDG